MSGKRDYSKSSIYKLDEKITMKMLQLYRDEPCLYDVKSEWYTKRHARIAALDRIADELGINGFGHREVALKFQHLRNSYSQELKKVKSSEISAGGGDAVYVPSIYWFRLMDSFLRPFMYTSPQMQEPGYLKTMPGERCAISICNNSRSKTKNLKNGNDYCIAYHKFPTDKKIKNAWIQRCRRADKINPDTSFICSIHFTADDYERDLKGELLHLKLKRILKKNAIPSQNLLSHDKLTIINNNTERGGRIAKRNNRKLVQMLLEEQQQEDTSKINRTKFNSVAGDDNNTTTGESEVLPDDVTAAKGYIAPDYSSKSSSLSSSDGEQEDRKPLYLATIPSLCGEQSEAASSQDTQDKDLYDYFGDYVTSVLRKLGDRRAAILQHEINGVIFKHTTTDFTSASSSSSSSLLVAMPIDSSDFAYSDDDNDCKSTVRSILGIT